MHGVQKIALRERRRRLAVESVRDFIIRALQQR